ncbi:unnamed protein product, partial [Effrenium voratum]
RTRPGPGPKGQGQGQGKGLGSEEQKGQGRGWPLVKRSLSAPQDGNPIAVWELKKVKASQLVTAEFPVVDREASKKAAEKEILAKAGSFARLSLVLADYGAAKEAVAELGQAKAHLESAWKDMKAVTATDAESVWATKAKACGEAYLKYLTKEEFANGCAKAAQKSEAEG